MPHPSSRERTPDPPPGSFNSLSVDACMYKSSRMINRSMHVAEPRETIVRPPLVCVDGAPDSGIFPNQTVQCGRVSLGTHFKPHSRRTIDHSQNSSAGQFAPHMVLAAAEKCLIDLHRATNATYLGETRHALRDDLAQDATPPR